MFILFEQKKCRGIIFHETEEGCKISRVTDFPHEKINRCLTDINRCLTDIFKI